MKKLFLFALVSLSVSSIKAGIYRHDVPVERYKELAAEAQFNCVGIILENATQPHGSCVLIGRRYVLSVAHCFIESETQKDTITVGNARVTTYKQVNRRLADITQYYFRFNRKLYRAKTITLHPAYLDPNTTGSCDIALIELAEEVKGITPMTLSTSFDELGSAVTGVGYGASGRADDPEDVGMYMEKIAGQNTVDTLEGYKLNGVSTLLSCDFDHPANKALNQTGSPIPQPLEYICSGGDSGGGLFREVKNGWELVGLCSGAGTNIDMLLVTGYYGQTMNWTRVSAFNDWIKQSIKEFEKQIIADK